MDTITLIEILKWPIVILILCVVLGVIILLTQKAAIGNLIRRIRRLPGGIQAEKQIPQQEKVDETKPSVGDLIKKDNGEKVSTKTELIQELEETILARSLDYMLRKELEQKVVNGLEKK